MGQKSTQSTPQLGRPSKYRDIDLKQVKKLAKKGFIDTELADFFNVTRDTIQKWKQNYPEFLHTIKQGKAEADAKVEKALFKRACGFTGPDGKYYPPDTGANFIWLKNRKPEKWRDKQTVAIEDSRPELDKYSDSQLEGAITFLEELAKVDTSRRTSKEKA